MKNPITPKPLRALVPAALLLVLTSCGTDHHEYRTIDGFAEGTSYHISYCVPVGAQSDTVFGQIVERGVAALLADFERKFSVYDSTSCVSRVNRGEVVDLCPDFIRGFRLAQQISAETGGAFDITVRPLIEAYRIGSDRHPRPIADSVRDSVMQFVGYTKARLAEYPDSASPYPQCVRVEKDDPRIRLDFNAIAKGYSVDLVARMLEGQLGITDYLVEIGGEVRCKGVNPSRSPWLVGVDRPVDGNVFPGAMLEAVIELRDCALATSGNYRNYAVDSLTGQRIVHTIDPRTGYPATHTLLSATIIADDCATADAYATACMVVGYDEAILLVESHPGLGAYLIRSQPDGTMSGVTVGANKKFTVKKP